MPTAATGPALPRALFEPAAASKAQAHEPTVALTAGQMDVLTPLRLGLAGKRLWRELRLLDRLCRRSTNQHRAAEYQRKTAHVRRVLERLRGLRLESLLPERPRAGAGHSAATKSTVDATPFPVLLRLVGAYAVLCKGLEVLEAAYLSYRGVAMQTYFMPLMLSLSAVVARLHVLARDLVKQCETCYDLVWAWSREVPPVEYPEYAWRLPPTLASYAAVVAPNAPRASTTADEMAVLAAQTAGQDIGDSDSEADAPEDDKTSAPKSGRSAAGAPLDEASSVSDAFWAAISDPPAARFELESKPKIQDKSKTDVLARKSGGGVAKKASPAAHPAKKATVADSPLALPSVPATGKTTEPKANPKHRPGSKPQGKPAAKVEGKPSSKPSSKLAKQAATKPRPKASAADEIDDIFGGI
ncbi:hypothetical protein HK105_207623 [Polyrhizophydium stewartii]|uniref:Nucleolus and neural progenitor protein-like N-terminal domain-containing protein n=1 Tax=Polyrhizophydium stewartii TaxID=2732419 RepID=A0ABR4MZZ8_9FUNG